MRSAAFAAALLALTAGVEADPAVSTPNAKFDARFGSAFDQGMAYGAGYVTLPLTEQFGVQVDGYVGTVGGNFGWQGGGHLFWRDPSIALFGIYADWTHTDAYGGVGIGALTGEFELYFKETTFRGIVGAQFSWDPGVVTGFFTDLRASWYPNEDLRLFGGYRHDQGANIGLAGAEWQWADADRATTLFAEGRLGDHDYRTLWGGIRIYLGPDKTLVGRHRQDDPEPIQTLIRGPDTTTTVTPTTPDITPPPPPDCECKYCECEKPPPGGD